MTTEGFSHWSEEWFDKAAIAWKEGQYEAASSAAQIAQAAVFLTDSEAVARQMVEETLHQAEVQTTGAAVAVERLAEATRILQRAAQSGPRHPAVHAALAVLTGESSLGVSGDSVEELTARLDASLGEAQEAARRAKDQPG